MNGRVKTIFTKQATTLQARFIVPPGNSPILLQR
jgi:hypothetical protein